MFKKKPIKKIFESASIESADVNPPLPESASDQSAESPAFDPREEGMEMSGGDQASGGEESIPADEMHAEDTESDRTEAGSEATFSNTEGESQGAASAEDSSSESHLPQMEEGETSDDILEDVRRALIEEEASKEQKESKWWRRIGRKSKTTEQPPASVEIDTPAIPAATGVTDVEEQRAESDEELLNELIDALQTETEDAPAPPTVTPEVVAEALPEPEPEPEIDFEQRKEQALGPRPAEEEPEELSSARSIALGGDEEVFVEVQPQVTDPFDERVKGFENALRPYRRYIYTALALLGAAVAVVAALIMFNVYKQSTAQPVAPNPNLPFPAAVSLPGGWSFKLGRGSLQDGKWEPQGAEWLQGTEVCRWVALPWSRQLEAVIRTLNPKDPIELVMSNNDKFTYKVYSVRQLSPEEMQKLDSNSPCLLLILTQPDSEKRWVLTAVP